MSLKHLTSAWLSSSSEHLAGLESGEEEAELEGQEEQEEEEVEEGLHQSKYQGKLLLQLRYQYLKTDTCTCTKCI